MICPNCKRDINDDSRFCRFCGAEFIGEECSLEIIPETDDNAAEYSAPLTPAAKKAVSPAAIAAKNKKLTIQILSAVAALCIICGVTICICVASGAFGDGKEVVTDATGDVVHPGLGTTEITITESDGTTRVIKTDRSLVTPSQILAEYTEVMNQLKTDAPAFKKVRYQNLPTANQNLGAVADIVLPIIEKYVTSKNVAEGTSVAAGNSNELPVKNSSYGCLLTDPAAIKKAYCEILTDDTYKLVITLNDEMNPNHLAPGATTSSSITTAVFDPYDAGEMITAISSLVLNDINFNYTDCTVTLVYNKKTKEVQSVDMTMNIDITANTILMQVNARIVDITEFSEFSYR